MMDADGTIIRSFMRETGAVEDYDRVVLLPNRFEAIRALSEQSEVRFALVSNQGGVAFGYQTEAQVYAKMAAVCAELNCFFGQPFSVHVCFEHPKATIDKYRANSPRRKPGPGLLLEAMDAHLSWDTDEFISDRQRDQAVFIGDLDTDREAAASAKVKYFDADAFFAG